MKDLIRTNRERALADPTRREMMALLAEERLGIRELAERLPGGPSLVEVNQHLAILQAADLVGPALEGGYGPARRDQEEQVGRRDPGAAPAGAGRGPTAL
jgi:DNA-binding transcriptional ArsR family regulator